MFKDAFVKQTLDSIEQELLARRSRRKIRLSREWASEFPDESGVYAAFENGDLVYIGETGKLSGRMTDLLDTRHHSLRRNIGKSPNAKWPKASTEEVEPNAPMKSRREPS